MILWIIDKLIVLCYQFKFILLLDLCIKHSKEMLFDDKKMVSVNFLSIKIISYYLSYYKQYDKKFY